MENKKVNDCNTKSKREIERLKERKSSGNVQQVFDWAETTSGWQGDDLDYCLEIVKNSRIECEF